MGLNEKLFTGGAGGSLVPSDNFNTVLYTGNGSAQNIDTVGFQPDFVWIKQRNDTNPHSIFDSVRGAGKLLSSQTTSEQAGNAGNLLGSFRPLGFQVNRTYLSSNFDNTNLSGATYVAWCWKAGGGKVTIAANTVGNTIASDVSANVAAGFSIVDYQANSTQGATIAHGLESPVEMIITKEYTGARVWCVYHKDLTNSGYYLELNTNSGEKNSLYTGYAAVPGSTVYTVGYSSVTNNPSSDSYIAYCFHSVAGYSKIGSYEGNGSSGGKSITGLGFNPTFVMLKAIDSSAAWRITDSERGDNKYLYANLGNGDDSASGYVSLITDGFRLNGLDSNQSQTFIYMAFA